MPRRMGVLLNRLCGLFLAECQPTRMYTGRQALSGVMNCLTGMWGAVIIHECRRFALCRSTACQNNACTGWDGPWALLPPRGSNVLNEPRVKIPLCRTDP